MTNNFTSNKSSKWSLLLIMAFGFITILGSCGEKNESENHESEEAKSEFTVIKDASFGNGVDNALAEKGAQIFLTKCTACHKLDQNYVGPSLGMVTTRRTANYIYSQILHPEEMIKNNDTVKALMAKFPTPMANQHLTRDEVKAVVEHLKRAASNGGK